MESRQDKINQAIRECLEHCYRSSSVVSGIAEFVARLRTSGAWQEQEIQTIETSARHILYGVVDGATYSGDASNAPASDVGPPDSKSPKSNGI